MSKWALIIGGSSGIGLASAKKLANEGFAIILIHRDRRAALADLELHFNEIKEAAPDFLPFNLDATNAEKIDQCIETISEHLKGQQIQTTLHAISRGNLKPMVGEAGKALTEVDLNMTMNAMCFNLLTWVQKLRSSQLIGDGSGIIALTSEGNKKYWDGYGAVAMAKAALETMIKYLSVELAKEGTTVNGIQAGITDTPSLRFIPNSDQLIEGAMVRNPYKRMTSPDDVANVVALLSNEKAQWVNGSIIHVDGGENFI